MNDAVQTLAPRRSSGLKVIYEMQERGQHVSTSAVRERLGTSPATVTMLFKAFAQAGWVEHVPYHGVRLTELGEHKALEVIRHHRLLELYLARQLGYRWDQVHAEAEQLEHIISEEFEEKLDALLGYPTVDPHGDPIPRKDGTITSPAGSPLRELAEGQPARITRILDQDPDKLRYLGLLGFYPATRVQLLERAPFGGPLRLRVGEGKHSTEALLGPELAQQILVLPTQVEELAHT
jgi:DtxR family Mn-dependent transcriptional regulator